MKSTKTFPAALTTTAALLMASSAHAALTISGKATKNVTCTEDVCKATAKNSVLNVADLAKLLSTSSVKIVSGSKAQDIVFDAPFSWTSANALTLDC